MVTRAEIVAKAISYDGLVDQGYKDNEFSREWGIAGLDYCGAFVSSIFWRLGAPLPDCGVKDGFLYVPYAVDYARANGQVVEVPGRAQPGDIALFCWDGIRHGGRSAVGDHTGIVVSHDGGNWLNVMEGNTTPPGGSRGCHRRSRSIDTIACYWSPAVFGNSPVRAEDDMNAEEHEWLRFLRSVLDVPGTGWTFPDGQKINTVPEFLWNLYMMGDRRDAAVTALTQQTKNVVEATQSQVTVINGLSQRIDQLTRSTDSLAQSIKAIVEANTGELSSQTQTLGKIAAGGGVPAPGGGVVDPGVVAKELIAEFWRRLAPAALTAPTEDTPAFDNLAQPEQ